MFGIQAVLYQFDDRNNQVGGVIPIEEVINIGFVLLLALVIFAFASDIIRIIVGR